MAAPFDKINDRNGGAPAKRSRMDAFIDRIELTAAVFIGIVAADVFITCLLYTSDAADE